ncbi:hypothetical protein K523DRAFT_358129 [Schizophyllum commune Tattone D]|nr:hypothetical protein K523DRAFT_358129 [Schizophyllum commune Tattone D]
MHSQRHTSQETAPSTSPLRLRDSTGGFRTPTGERRKITFSDHIIYSLTRTAIVITCLVLQRPLLDGLNVDRHIALSSNPRIYYAYQGRTR